MATIAIKPFQAVTVAGWPVTIDGLYLISSDFLAGTIHAPAGDTSASWDSYGRCRDHSDDCNLVMDNDQLREAIETAKALRTNINRP